VNSRNIVIENVTITAAGGMGLIVERTENVRLDRMKVTSTENRLVSTRADATHFIGCKGLIEVTNCLFEHMLDDGINVHGAYVPVVKHLEGTTFLCEISHHQQWGFTFAEPGDKVAILSRKTVLPFFETTVSHIRKLNERRFVITLESLPPELPDVPLSLENLTWNPDLVMRNNIIRENRARSVLVTTKGSVVIENNTFSSQMHGILIEGDNDFWYESGAVKDVVIRNNLFENIGFGSPRSYPLLAAPKFTRDQHMGEGRYHRNIVFSGNRVRSFTGNLVHALSVENLTIAGNRMELSRDYPVSTSEDSVRLEYCREVTIRDNVASGFDGLLNVNASKDSESVRLEKNSGWAHTGRTPQAPTRAGQERQLQPTSP
jgi:polygalacturonase